MSVCVSIYIERSHGTLRPVHSDVEVLREAWTHSPVCLAIYAGFDNQVAFPVC